jgi:hypothetical protein
VRIQVRRRVLTVMAGPRAPEVLAAPGKIL